MTSNEFVQMMLIAQECLLGKMTSEVRAVSAHFDRKVLLRIFVDSLMSDKAIERLSEEVVLGFRPYIPEPFPGLDVDITRLDPSVIPFCKGVWVYFRYEPHFDFAKAVDVEYKAALEHLKTQRTMENRFLVAEVRLSAMHALLHRVTPNIRSVKVEADSTIARVRIQVDQEATDLDKQHLQEIADMMRGDFDTDFSNFRILIRTELIRNDYPQLELHGLTPIYRRYEPVPPSPRVILVLQK